MVSRDWQFDRCVCHVTGQAKEAADWNGLYVRGIPIQPDGSLMLLCHSVPEIISQTTTEV